MDLFLMIGAEFKIYPRAVENEIPYNLIDGIFEIEKKSFHISRLLILFMKSIIDYIIYNLSQQPLN